MEIGVCSCNAGRDGSPCSHQAAVVRHYKIFSINCIPVTSEARQLLAKVAVENSSLPPEFYSSLHEKKVIPQEKKQKDSLQGPFWDLARCQGTDDNDGDDDCGPQKCEEEELHQKIEQVFTDVMKRIKESTVVAEGAKVFCKRYFDMRKKKKIANATIGSVLYKFGWKH